MNFVWRTVSIGVVSGLTCTVLAILTLLNTDQVDTVMEEVSQAVLILHISCIE